MRDGNDQNEIQGNKLVISMIAMLSAFMALMDVTIVNVALNDIRTSFGTPLDQIGWVSTGYMMANIVVIPMTGWMQKRFGMGRYLSYSLVLFTGASALCGLSWNLTSLVLFRALQGLGGGAIIPTAQSILLSRYSLAERGTAAALFGLGAMTGPLLGPTIGGHLINWLNWHAVFWINVPIGIVVFALAIRSINQPSFQQSREPIDLRGILLLVIGMASLQYVLEEGNREEWFESRTILVLALLSCLSVMALLMHELRTPYPIVNLRIFKGRQYTLATLINLMVGFAMFSGSFLFSLFCGAVLHFDALETGHVFLGAGCIQIVLMPLMGRVMGRFDARILLAMGAVMITWSLLESAQLTDQSSFFDVVHTQLFRAAGLSLIFIPVNVLALSEVPKQAIGHATGLFSLTRELGGSIGTAWMSQLMAHAEPRYSAILKEAVTLENPLFQIQSAALHAGMKSAPDALPSEAIIGLRLKIQALVLSFHAGFNHAAAVFGCTLFLLLFIKRPKPMDIQNLH